MVSNFVPRKAYFLLHSVNLIFGQRNRCAPPPWRGSTHHIGKQPAKVPNLHSSGAVRWATRGAWACAVVIWAWRAWVIGRALGASGVALGDAASAQRARRA
jgi:hypothetical protein